MKTAYQTDSNRLFTGPVLCPRDPEEPDRYLLPHAAYWDEPPIAGERQIQQRTEDLAGWQLISDYRGLVYWTADRTRHEITEAGIEPPDGWLPEDPGPSPDELAAATKRTFLAQVAKLLKESDVTVIRCAEDGIPVPAEWKAWREHLRQLRRDESGVIGDPPVLTW